jgi:MFS family permease
MNKRFIPAYLLTLVNVLGFSILMPILPFVIEDYGAEEWVYGLMLTLYSAFQFIGAPYLGAKSDELGRKPVLLISQLGTLLSWFIFLFALFLPNMPIWGIALPLLVIGVSRALDGLTGGNTSVANAYISDITTRTEKSYIFGYLGGISGIGMIIGPGIGGLAASTSWGYKGTIVVAIIISIITLFAIITQLQESHPIEKRQKRKKEPFYRSLFILAQIKEAQPKPIIKLLFLTKFFFALMMAFYISTIALFVIDLFHFDQKELGIFMVIVGLFLAFNQAFLSRIVIRKIGEFPTLILGLFLCTVGLVCLTLTSNFWLYISFYYVMNLGLSLSFPTFNALIAAHADPQKQGAVMGISESINSFARALFPILGAYLYGQLNFKVYYLIAFLPFIALLIAFFGYRHFKKKNVEMIRTEN